MTYLVSLTARAERDLAFLFEAIHAEDSETALAWYRGLKKAILNLEKFPNRCPPSLENARLRNLLYGRKPHVYRVIYRVLEKERRVEVLHVRHGARRPLKQSDL
jgi:plasmid stabilization system protein ParE